LQGPQDKSRSTAALEMVMSGRLDEQGFEKFFADPPAALIVIKGLQTLVERNMPPGLAPVGARGAGESAAGEFGMKKCKSAPTAMKRKCRSHRRIERKIPMPVGIVPNPCLPA
jgi:hypothetical protein